MSAIVAAMRMTWLRAGFAMIAGDDEQSELLSATVNVACNTLNAASNAAGAGRVVAMRLADCGCVEVTHGDGTTRIDPFMPWKCDPRPCAWPRPFARSTP